MGSSRTTALAFCGMTTQGVAMLRELLPTQLPDGTWLRLECGHHGRPGEHGPSVDCQDCNHRLIPPTTTTGRRTPTFTTETVPPALLAAHRTSAWAELVVLEGAVAFVDQDPPWCARATPDRRVVIVPERHHHIEPETNASFYVQFHDSPRFDKTPEA